jgi:hypothetical protein
MLTGKTLERIGKSVILTIIFFVAAKVLASPWLFAKLIKDIEYQFLQGQMASAYQSRKPQPKLPVVIDIGEFDPLGGDAPTNRKKLNELLNQLRQYNPAAIGIDIDFSSSSERLVDPEDLYYFDQWKNLKSSDGSSAIPVRLGVANRIGDGGNWLGRPEFSGLAAGIVVPDPVTETNSDYFFTWVGRRGDRGTELPQMAFALYRDSLRGGSTRKMPRLGCIERPVASPNHGKFQKVNCTCIMGPSSLTTPPFTI